ncbi:uncharacterized protein N7482_005425 [Penicillium canariense]|uniref:ribonuclease H n=1 Tax=Penicillium canariense TaxID=189055 RepID=A0A9W9LM93_9EURO|nr:uncharacterized protein N7482_005425 [Penicillium canariense]KAJ5166644.1 hypothetical protein N7482_005425 [Penicillium canariense]
MANNRDQDFSQAHREYCHLPEHHPSHEDDPSSSEHPSRTFPIDRYNPAFIKPQEIEAFDGSWVFMACPGSTTNCPHCKNHVYHIGCLVVSISGALSTTSDPPRSSIGVFFGPDNKKNLASVLDGDKHTTQTAELKACLEALTRLFVLHTTWQIEPPKKSTCYPLHTVIIKSDSEYVVMGATEWLSKWKENGWKKGSGQPVANPELWRLVDSMLKQLEYDIKVEFWLVRREMNGIAIRFAKEALGEA